MKKIYTSVLSCLLLFSVLNEADARVTKVEESEPLKMKRAVNTWSCTDFGAAYHNSQPQGFTCNSVKIRGRICYNNCSSNCNSNNYPYTSASNCEADGGVVGPSCEYNGTTRYKCSCPSSYAECVSPKTGNGGHCTVNGQNKYASCECPSEYQYDANNCDGTLSGHVCDGKYTQCTSSQPECTPYPYTLANCASPKVLGGNTCNNTYETCTCPSIYQYDATNCASPKVLAGDVCNNKYEACQCPDDWAGCGSREVGIGEACEEDGEIKYASCEDSCTEQTYPYTEQNCPSYIGVLEGETCILNGQTRYEACNCKTNVGARTCPSGKIGVGQACNGKYIACAKICEVGDYIYDDYHCYASYADMHGSEESGMYGAYHSWGQYPRGIVIDKTNRLAITFGDELLYSPSVGFGVAGHFYESISDFHLLTTSNQYGEYLPSNIGGSSVSSYSVNPSAQNRNPSMSSFDSSKTTLNNGIGISDTNVYTSISGWSNRGLAAFCRSYVSTDNFLASGGTAANGTYWSPKVPWMPSNVEHFVPTIGDLSKLTSLWTSGSYSKIINMFPCDESSNGSGVYKEISCGGFGINSGTVRSGTSGSYTPHYSVNLTRGKYNNEYYYYLDLGGNTAYPKCFIRYPAGY